MAQAVGLIDIVWKGKQIPVEKGATILLGGMKNNPIVVNRQVDRSQEFVGSEINATTTFRKGTSAVDLFDPGEGELQVKCDTGQTYIFPEAFLTIRPTITGGDGGKVKLTWSAGEGEELIA
jgi:hypothetical protein